MRTFRYKAHDSISICIPRVNRLHRLSSRSSFRVVEEAKMTGTDKVNT
jgi:hypothetical protein